jgi:hypothetical protein
MKTEDNLRPQESLYSVVMHLENGSAVIDNKDIYLLYFIEDIFSSCVAGKLEFSDPYGVFELGPITGNERITVIYGVGEEIERDFTVYKINRIDQQSSFERSGMQAFELFFVDNMFYDLNYQVFSRSWANTRISDIVSDICENYLYDPSFKEFESSVETLSNYYSPYWTPRENIRWLMRRASGFSSGQAGYLFYNNLRGSNFVTIDKLLSSKPINNDQYILGPSSEFTKNQVLYWSHLGIDTTSMKVVQGGTVRGYDSSTKAFKTDEHEYSTSIAKHVLLGNFSIYPDIDNKLSYQSLDGDPDELILGNINQYDFISRYNRQMLTQIVVPGESKDRYCGGIIEIDWPSTVPQHKINKMMKGYYLIKSITHQWAAEQSPPFIQKMVLVKNAYTDADVGKVVKLVKATKTNQSGVASLISPLL